MASQIPEFEYDIFISYRQKDNKGDRWVSEFVEALKTEIDSTFKEEISVYFDINPHDGLLETHDVNETLKKKLKCLIFIPVISRTYCDPNSFAWKYEFSAFIDLASSDQYGLKITLPNGNVISRVLPIRIHELDTTDIELCESLLGGAMRGIDFVYRSPGVNRPLRSIEDHPNDNLNRTYYRDQINKLSNSIRELIDSLRHTNDYHSVKPNEIRKDHYKENKHIKAPVSLLQKRKGVRLLLLFIIIISLVSVIYLYFRENHLSNIEKTIAVIPLTNPPNDPELAKYAIGSMDAIITKLQDIKSLTVRGRLSSLQYLDTKKNLESLRKELNSNYLVVLNISKSANSLNMWIGLNRTKNDLQMWAEQYDWNEEQLMPLFTKVVQTIAGKLNIQFTNQEIINIEKDLTKNRDAYLNYLTGSAGLLAVMGKRLTDSANFRAMIGYYDKAIEKDPGFANAYARRAIAISFGIRWRELDSAYIDKCWSDINNASKINEDLSDVQIARGFYYYYCKKDYDKALISFNIAAEKDPENYQPIFYMAMVYRAMGNWKEVQTLFNKVIQFNLQDPLVLTNIGLTFEYLRNFDSALIYHQKAMDVDPHWIAAYVNKFGSLLLKNGNTEEAHALLNMIEKNSHEKHTEGQIMLDMYDGKYRDALTKATNANPEEFGSEGIRLMYIGNISLLLNDKANADKYFSSALDEFNQQLENDYNNASLHSLIGLAFAGKRMEKEALKEGELAIQIAGKSKDKCFESDIILNMAEIYTKLGRFKEAIDTIESLLENPSLITAKMLKLDPVWKPLLASPELKEIIAKYDK